MSHSQQTLEEVIARTKANKAKRQGTHPMFSELLVDEIEALRAKLAAAEAKVSKRKEIRDIIICAVEWCEAVQRGTFWDYWGYHYKKMSYNLLPAIDIEPRDESASESAEYVLSKAMIAAIDAAIGSPSYRASVASRYEGALKKLACLGNGDQPGNSIGNIIAQEALNPLNSAREKALDALTAESEALGLYETPNSAGDGVTPEAIANAIKAAEAANAELRGEVRVDPETMNKPMDI